MQCWKSLEIQWQLEALNSDHTLGLGLQNLLLLSSKIHILKFRPNLELPMTKYEAPV